MSIGLDHLSEAEAATWLSRMSWPENGELSAVAALAERLTAALEAAGRNGLVVHGPTILQALKLMQAIGSRAPAIANHTDMSAGPDRSIELVASLPGHCIEIFIAPGDDAFDVLSEDRESGEESEYRFARVAEVITKLAALDAA